MFVHHVFFWLKEGLNEIEIKKFETAVTSLLKISYILNGDIGKASSTKRPVIDSSYSYSLLLLFKDKDAHDAYQVDPIHLQFVESCSPLWTKVQIYDSESLKSIE